MTIAHSLSDLLALESDEERYEALKSLVQHVLQNQTDIAGNGWDGTANPNSFDSHRYVLTTGTSTAYVATFSPTFGSLQDGCMLKVDFHTASGVSPTLNLDSLGAKALVNFDGSAIVAGAIAAGAVLTCIYSAAFDEWIVLGIAALAGDPETNNYDLTGTASDSRYTASGTKFITARFTNEGDEADATATINISDGTTASKVLDAGEVPQNGGFVIGFLVFKSGAYIEAQQDSGNVRMTIEEHSYPAGKTPVTTVEAIGLAEETVHTASANGGVYTAIMGNIHTADVKGYIKAGDSYITSHYQIVAVNDLLQITEFTAGASAAIKADNHTSADNLIVVLTGWE